MTVVTIQSYRIISNEVKDSQALLEPSDGKKVNLTFLPTQYYYSFGH